MKASVEIGTGMETVPTQSIETYQAIRPQKLIACVSKVAHYITKSNPQVCEWDLNAGKDGCVQLDVVFPQNGDAPTAFDMAVHMATVSLYEAGNRIITIAMICRTLCMSTKQKCFSENLQALVKASVYKLMRIRIRINAQSQKQQYQLERTEYNDYMLNLCETVARADNGVVSECFRFNCAPVVYSYSKAIKQYWSIPVQDVETSGRITNTISVIAVRYALLRRIVIIKRKRKNYKISLESLFKECRAVCGSKEKLRGIARDVLECWWKSGFIHSYETYKEYRTIKGFVVSLKKSRPPKKRPKSEDFEHEN